MLEKCSAPFLADCRQDGYHQGDDLFRDKENSVITIRTFDTALGGYEYRATGNKEVVNFQEKSPNSSRFRTVKTISREKWVNEDMKELTIAQFSRACRED